MIGLYKSVMEYIIVQAGGKGTRLKHLTENKPKALVPVDNLPMLFHLFRKYPDKRYVIIADYKKEVMREYLDAFADVKYDVVDASGSGTCAGVKQAIRLLPNNKPFMLVWSDLILPTNFKLPDEYEENKREISNYVGISQSFACRWKYENGVFTEETSIENGVAGLFLFKDKSVIKKIPESGELVRWLSKSDILFDTIGLAGTKEFGLLEEYEKFGTSKCRPFNKITIQGSYVIKEPLDNQGIALAKRECAWYEKAKDLGIDALPLIYDTQPLKMEFIEGKNIYECNLGFVEKKSILEKLVTSLNKVHSSECVEADTFSIKEAYFNKTFDRLAKIQDLVPYGREKHIVVNGRVCRNVYFYKRELERMIDRLVENCQKFEFIHGDCTFSNMMLRANGNPVIIDPRGYFGYSEMYGDTRYDWAKVYYSIIGNYDQFNLKKFKLKILENNRVELNIESNHWEDMAGIFLKMIDADEYEIKLLHALIWLSLTTYAWQDYDSICGAFYNGLYYLEEVL